MNAGLGIDLGGDGPTPNDALDADSGPNDFQNYPVLTAVTAGGGSTTITGSLHSTPNTTFTLEFFGNLVPGAQGEFYLGNSSVTTDSSGDAAFTVTLPVVYGTSVTATATNPGGSTSEFASNLPIPEDPPGPPSGRSSRKTASATAGGGSGSSSSGGTARGALQTSGGGVSDDAAPLAPFLASTSTPADTDAATGARETRERVQSLVAFGAGFAGEVRAADSSAGVTDRFSGTAPGEAPGVVPLDGLTLDQLDSLFALGPPFGE
jgi:hypothetical protein